MSGKTLGTAVIRGFLTRRQNLSPRSLFCGCSRLSTGANPVEKEGKDASGFQTAEKAAQTQTEIAKHSKKVAELSPTKMDDKSFARGLFLNEMRTSDLTYPEIPETEELHALQDFCAAIKRYANTHIDSHEIDAQREIPVEVKKKLAEMGVFGLQIPKQYGGLGFNQKEHCAVFEALSLDWSILTNWIVTHDLVAKAIMQFGTEEQKSTYLPQLARGEISGAFCLHEETSGHDITDMKTFAQYSAASEGKLVLRGVKNWVTNGRDAELLIVFGKLCEHEAEDISGIPTSAFIVDRRLHGDQITVIKRKDTTGLKGLDICDLEFSHVVLSDSDVLGQPREGFRIATEIVRQSNSPFGAAAANFVKRQLTAIESRSHRELRFERRLADTVVIKKRVADMSMYAYVLESMSYFVAGMQDEDATRDFALEGAMIKWLSNKWLRECLLNTMAVMGAKSLESSDSVERHLRDITTLSCFLNNDDLLSGYIAMEGLQTWAMSHSGDVEKTTDYMKYPHQMLKRKFSRRGVVEYKPKYQHYINEHVHPSLEHAARLCEEVMFKFEDIFVDCYVRFGQQIEDEQQMLDRLAEISTLIFAMLTVISRSSRSYSIGLQNCELELFMAHNFCEQSRFKILQLLADLEKFDDADLKDTSMKRIGEKILKQRGYLIESPLQRNW